VVTVHLPTRSAQLAELAALQLARLNGAIELAIGVSLDAFGERGVFGFGHGLAAFRSSRPKDSAMILDRLRLTP
jgi:hypothetical protein